MRVRVCVARIFLYNLEARINGTWRSLVAHHAGGVGVASSNLAVPTKDERKNREKSRFFLFRVLFLRRAHLLALGAFIFNLSR